jgi:hypothetical protein
MPSYSSPIILLMIRENSTPSQDDRITIRKNLESECETYSLWYTDTNAETTGKSVSQTLESMSRSNTIEHMRVVIKSLAFDEQGFDRLQFDVPGMPRMLISVKKMREVYYREHITDMVCAGLDAMKASTKVAFVEDRTPEAGHKRRCCSPLDVSSPPRIARHTYFDMGDEDDNF